MKDVRHIIRRQVLELKGVREADAQDFQERFALLFKQEVLPLLDAYLSQHSPTDEPLRIERLTLDLGPIAAGDLEGQIMAQLERQLPIHFPKAPKGPETPGGPLEKLVQPASEITAHFQVLAFFLEKGRLPWWAQDTGADVIGARVALLAQKSKEQLRRSVHRWMQYPPERKRLLQHLPFPAWLPLVQIKLTDSAHDPATLLGQLQQLLRPPDQPLRAFEKNFAAIALAYLYLSPEVQPADTDFWNDFLYQWAGSTRQSYAKVIRGLYTKLADPPYPKTEEWKAARAIVKTLFQEASTKASLRGPKEKEETTQEKAVSDRSEEPTPSEEEARAPKSKADLSTEDQAAARRSPEEKEDVLVGEEPIEVAAQENALSDRSEESTPSEEEARAPKSKADLSTEDQAAARRSPEEKEDVVVGDEPLEAAAEDKDQKGQEPKGEPPTEIDPAQAEQPSIPSSPEMELPNDRRADKETQKQKDFSDTEEIYISNAGLVMCWPFMATFFERLGLLVDQQFTDEAARQRAVTLLQYLADGQERPLEYRCSLNKILCGMPINAVLEWEEEFTPEEMKEADQLLQALLTHATVLGELSPDGLRGSYLLRSGRLLKSADVWQLHVESAPYDILLGKLPWSWDTVKLPWMGSVILVEWQKQ